MEKHYCILESIRRIDLEELVTEQMAKGWTPQGGIAVYWNDRSNYPVYLQAMVKSK